MRCGLTVRSILSFLPQRPKSWQHQVPYWPGDWIAKKWTILCGVIALSKQRKLRKDSFIHHGLVAIMIFVEMISDKRTYLCICSLFFPSGFVMLMLWKSGAPGRPLGVAEVYSQSPWDWHSKSVWSSYLIMYFSSVLCTWSHAFYRSRLQIECK